MAEKQAIKAYVRIRPFTAKEMAARPQPCIRAQGKRVLVDQEVVALSEIEAGKTLSSPRGVSAVDQNTSQNLTFDFDGVFWSVPPNQVLTETEAQDDYYLSVLPPYAQQEQLFQEVGMSAIDSLLKGFPVTVFAYGQTGSGKSHTIFGPISDPGLSPRMAIEMFKIFEAEKAFGWRAEVALSCFEIYNEKVSDLLNKTNLSKTSPKGRRGTMMSTTGRKSIFTGMPSSPLNEDLISESGYDLLTPRTNDSSPYTPRTPRNNHGGGEEGGDEDEESTDVASTTDAASTLSPPEPSGLYSQNSAYFSSPSKSLELEAKELRVRQHPDLGVFVEGLRKEQVCDAVQLTNAIHTALNHRVTAATRMNDTSSRSHAVIQISVDIRDEVQGKRRSATLNIVDLAGSERISRSGVSGQQLNEAKNINLSLTTLRRVIDVITENMEKKHKNKQVPPFRESTLTWILMDCFGGSAITIMLATASPHIDNISDTISTMRYATKCKTIVNQVKSNESKIAVTIAAINAESERLRRNLKESEVAKIDFDTMIKTEKAKIQRKQNVIRAVMKPACERIKSQALEAQRRLDQVMEALEVCNKKVASKEKKDSFEEEAAELMAKNSIAKAEAETAYRQTRKVEDEITQLKAELNLLLGIQPTGKAASFKQMRRQAIRLQIIMYAQEQRDKPLMAKLREENAALRAKIDAFGDVLAAIDEQIAEERRQVDIAAEPERAKDAAAQKLGEAHENISASVEGYRQDTGNFTRQTQAALKDVQKTEEQLKSLIEDFKQWESFHLELKAQLDANMMSTEKGATSLLEETNKKSLGLAALKRRRKEASDACIMLDEEIRLESIRLGTLEGQMAIVRGKVSDLVAALRDDDEERSSLQNALFDAQSQLSIGEKQCTLTQQAICNLEHVIRTKCFPSASGLYGDKVLAKMAVDLDRAAAVTPTQLEHMRRALSPVNSPKKTNHRRTGTKL